MKYSIYGHSYIRTFYHFANGDGERKYFCLPGGAAMLQVLLNGKSAEEALPSFDGNYRIEYFELKEFKRKDNATYFAAVRKLGRQQGIVKTDSEQGDCTIVWDNGFGEIALGGNDKNVFWASRSKLPEDKNLDKIQLLMVSADVLREKGAMISKAVSWERTAMNLLWQLRNNKNISSLLEIPAF